MNYLGDFAEDVTVYAWWDSNDGDGASITRATDGTIKVRRDDGTDCTGSSVTDTEDTPDTGVHSIAIDSSDSANFAVGHDYLIWLDGATIDSQVVNAAIASFSIENRFAEVDLTQIGGVAQSATDLKDFADTGYDPSTHVAKADLHYILAHLLTQTGTQVADAFQKMYDVAAPTATCLSLPDAVPGEAGGVFIAGTNAATAITTALTANIIGDVTGTITGNLIGTVSTLTTYTGNTPQTADNNTILAHVTYGNAALRTQGDSAWITATGFNTTTPDAAGTAATLLGTAGASLTDLGGMSTGMKAEVESEANDALVALNLDHLMKTAVASNADMTTEVPDGTVISNMLSKTSDTSTYTVADDSLEANRDAVALASIATEARLAELDAANIPADVDSILDRVNNLSTGSAAIATTATSFEKVGAEPETGTYTNTVELNGVFHIVEDDSTSTDVYYEFSVGGNGVPVQVTWDGYANPDAATYDVFAYKWAGTPAWQQVGTLDTKNDQTVKNRIFDLTNAHVGTGADIGKVRFRILSTDGTAFGCDRLTCAYAVVAQSAGYANGMIWINTNESNTGTAIYVDGTADNPVSTWAAAKTLSASLGIESFNVIGSITLDSDSTDYQFSGSGYALALGGQTIDNAQIVGANVTGVGVAGTSETHFDTCHIGTVTLGMVHARHCTFNGTITLTDSKEAFFYSCGDGVTAGGANIIVFVANASAYFRDYHGGIQLNTLAATNECIIDGNYRVVIHTDCAGGDLTLRGNASVTDNVSGGFAGTFTDDARWNEDQTIAVATTVTNQVDADVIAISGDTTAANNAESAFDGGTYNVGGGAVVAASVTGAAGSVTAGVNVNRFAGFTVSATGGKNIDTFFENAGSTTAQTVDDVGAAASANVNITGIAGTSIPALDGVNWHTFYNAAGSTSTKDQDDVGTAISGGTAISVTIEDNDVVVE